MTQVLSHFRALVGSQAVGCWFAPGRINLIGEYTDYNGGAALPAALSQGTYVAAEPRSDGLVVAHSCQRPGMSRRAVIEDSRSSAVPDWADYALGVLWALRAEGRTVSGLNLVVDSDLPLGAGLSSSAAMTCAIALACNDLFDLGLSADELVLVAQRAEKDYVGVPVGVLDQSASLLCRRDHVLLVDTATRQTHQIPLALATHDLALVAINTRVAHQLADGAYADRRRTCERAASQLGISSLCEIKPAELPAALDGLTDQQSRKRVRHVVLENERVWTAVDLLRGLRLQEVGLLLTSSHTSLRDDFEVSSPELDTAVTASLGAGALGARMTGGGFGGSALALVATDCVEQLMDAVAQAFLQKGFRSPEQFVVALSDGARRVM